MATPTEIELEKMGINILTKAEYDALTTKNDNEFYLITDDDGSDLDANLKSYHAIIMEHHITIQGTSTDSMPFALCFTVRCPYSTNAQSYTKVTTVAQLKTLMSLYSYQGVCSGYYISFNVDVMSFGSQSFKYYQNTAMVEKDPSIILDGTISSIEDAMQTIPLTLVK